MKKPTTTSLYAASLIILIVTAILAPRADAHVRMVYPMGGETFIQGGDVTIEWIRDQEHNQIGWDLSFSTDGGLTWQTIVTGVPEGQFTYDWRVPKNAVTTMSARIRVVQNNVGVDYEAESNNFTLESIVTGVEDSDDLPTGIRLLEAYPNPFSDASTFAFSVDRSGPVKLEVFNLQGQKVAVLIDRALTSGSHEISWNAESQPNGIYFYRIRAGNYSATRAVVLSR